MSKTLALYNRISKYPLGKRIFSWGVSYRAPYFSTIHPLITELRPGCCRVEIKERRSIRNHIGTIHAGALCTLSELTGGLAVEASILPDLRWIPKGMKVAYSRKAKGVLRGECSFDPQVLAPGDVDVALEVYDEEGNTVLEATILFYITAREPA